MTFLCCLHAKEPAYEVSRSTEWPLGFPLHLPPATKVDLPRGGNWRMSLLALF